MKNYLLLSFTFLMLFSAKGQDMRFSQFYAAPLYTNPAFTGATIEHRLVVNYRHQWPNIPGAFESYHASYEYNAADINSGFGLMMNREEAGSFGLTTNSVAFSYAYRFQINRKMILQPGLKIGYGFRGIDYDKLVFNDQLESGSSSTLDVDAFADENSSYADISAGLLLYAENYWVSSSLNHINKPNQALLANGNSELPMKFTFQAGYKFSLSGPVVKRRSSREITTALHYDAQGKFDQFDIGAYYNHAPFTFGFWYRGIPGFKRYDRGYANNDAVILLVGFSIPDRNLRVGYSYDVTISRLISDSGGAHEISLVYEFASKKSKRKSRRFIVPCAKF
ncbi:MAG: type IX secretion system membrane protein PorP/SprF [Vicingaceae bacterium]